MAFNIDFGGKVVTIFVKGEHDTDLGAIQKFDFSLTTERVNLDVIEAAAKRMASDVTYGIVDFFVERANAIGAKADWKGPINDAGEQVPFSIENLRALFKIPGIPILTWAAYNAGVAVRPKS